MNKSLLALVTALFVSTSTAAYSADDSAAKTAPAAKNEQPAATEKKSVGRDPNPELTDALTKCIIDTPKDAEGKPDMAEVQKCVEGKGMTMPNIAAPVEQEKPAQPAPAAAAPAPTASPKATPSKE